MVQARFRDLFPAGHARCLIAVLFLLVWAPALFGQRLKVKIIQWQSSETKYNYVVPGYFNAPPLAPACGNCSGQSATADSPSRPVYYSVAGATYSLLLPDGRVAVVNCASKPQWAGGYQVSHRSCRMPTAYDVEAEFNKDKAKLYWSVSLDGTKLESETYKILEILPAAAVPAKAGPLSPSPGSPIAR